MYIKGYYLLPFSFDFGSSHQFSVFLHQARNKMQHLADIKIT